MLSRMKRVARRLIKNTIQKRDLYRLPEAQTDVSSLRETTASDLSEMMNDEAIGKDWERAESRINDVIEVGHVGVGGVNPGDRRALYHLVRSLSVRTFLEIGTNIGTSTRAIACAMQESRAGPGSLTTVDILDVNDAPDAVWKSASLPLSPGASLEQLGLAELVDFQVADSIEFLATVDAKYDAIFLDGDHNAKAVYKEVPLALRKLNEGGVIILHDYVPADLRAQNANVPIGPGMAMDRLSSENPAIGVVPLGELPWPTKRGSNRTTLAIVTKV